MVRQHTVNVPIADSISASPANFCETSQGHHQYDIVYFRCIFCGESMPLLRKEEV